MKERVERKVTEKAQGMCVVVNYLRQISDGPRRVLLAKTVHV